MSALLLAQAAAEGVDGFGDPDGSDSVVSQQ